jgi:formylglycine-generating enzyme required for sulfatase activity
LAAQYCVWLTAEDGIGEGEQCYNRNSEPAQPVGTHQDYLHRTGYRLPTEAEWEYACRAGAPTSRSFGDAEELMAEYAWYLQNADGFAHPVGVLMPNSFGLFDMHGNAWEWCHDWFFFDYPKGTKAAPNQDLEQEIAGDMRCLRGGSFDDPAIYVRSAKRHAQDPMNRTELIGFRIARTLEQ